MPVDVSNIFLEKLQKCRADIRKRSAVGERVDYVDDKVISDRWSFRQRSPYSRVR